METFLGDVIRVLREESTALITLGSVATFFWGGSWSGIDLDFYQFHIHDWIDEEHPHSRSPEEYGITDKLLFGTDYPFASASASIDGLRNVNHVIGDSGLPRVTEDTIEGILSRDALGLLGIT